MTWIQTLDGAAFDLLEPDYQKINPDTIAACLAKTCRFKGHCRGFYSVAQHSLLVESLVFSDDLRLPALLHDAHEVYTGFGDVARPAKYINDDMRRFLSSHERFIDVQIAKRFGFDPVKFQHEQIKQADGIALATEQRDVMVPCDRQWSEMPAPSPVLFIEPMDMDEAMRRFSARLYELWIE